MSTDIVAEMAACSFDEYKQRAAEFFRKLPGASEDQREAGFHALALSYIYMTGNENEQYQAAIVLKLACRKMNES